MVLDLRQQSLDLTPELVQQLAHRRAGVGCDQLITLDFSQKASVFMRIYNADGSQVEACGNATRCVGQYLAKETGQAHHTIETVAGLLTTKALDQTRVEICLGTPKDQWDHIPLASAMDTLHVPFKYEGLSDPVAVNVGNPHLVFFVYDTDTIPLDTWGEVISNHPLFPQRINVEVVEVLAEDRLRMRVYERGTGITPACGTGAAASLIAANRRGYTGRHATVQLDGGLLQVDWRVDGVYLTGEATCAFTGQLSHAC